MSKVGTGTRTGTVINSYGSATLIQGIRRPETFLWDISVSDESDIGLRTYIAVYMQIPRKEGNGFPNTRQAVLRIGRSITTT